MARLKKLFSGTLLRTRMILSKPYANRFQEVVGTPEGVCNAYLIVNKLIKIRCFVLFQTFRQHHFCSIQRHLGRFGSSWNRTLTSETIWT